MKIGIIAQGTNGDIELLVPLALELSHHNHDVDLLIITLNNRDYSFLNNCKGLNVHQIDIYSEFMGEQHDFEFWNQTDISEDTILDKLHDRVVDDIVDFSYQFSQKNDLLIGSHHVYELSCIAEKFHKPYASVNYPLEYIRTKYEPPFKFSHINDLDNNKLWDLWDNHCNLLKRRMNKFRIEHGLNPIKNVRQEILVSKFLNIIPYSKYLCNRKPDWEDSFQVTGFLKPASGDYNEWNLSDNLLEFIGDREKPVFITVGSMEIHENDLRNFQDILLKASSMVKRKVIILSNWENGNTTEGNVYKLKGFVSYSKILKKCNLVVHHGGMGTLHNATEAGCPSIVITYGHDQPYNAKLLYDLGISNGSIDRKELSAEKLAGLINNALENKPMQKKAQQLALLLQNENGLKQTVELIETKMTSELILEVCK